MFGKDFAWGWAAAFLLNFAIWALLPDLPMWRWLVAGVLILLAIRAVTYQVLSEEQRENQQ